MGFLWIRNSSADASRERRRSDGSYVRCPTCSCEFPLVGTQRLPKEFSAPCPNCGHRNVYQEAEAHDPKQDADATRTPRKIQFGKKASMPSSPG
jgi:DNA-directed RNA polymerase subunit RPC12/RpoP